MTTTDKDREDDPLLTVAEFAARLRVDATTARRWVIAGTVPCVILPHSRKRRGYRIKTSTLHAILKGEKP